MQALAIAAYLKVNELSEFYALAVIFGVAYGGVHAAVRLAGARLLRPAHHGHRVRRGDHAVESRHGDRPGRRRLGIRHVHNYAWLYIASAAVAVGAVLLATLFPKPIPIRMAG